MKFMTYNDTDSFSDSELVGKTIGQAFTFSANYYSIRQAILKSGFFLRKNENHSFKVTADGVVLYEGNLCFYDYFLDESADFLADYKMIRFCDLDDDIDFVIENHGGKYLCYEI